MREVAVIGVGATPFRPLTPEVNWKELTFQAAVQAYEDAGIDPRKDVDSFITCAEDYWEGFSIFDEFSPDQLGGALRPMHTVPGDGLLGLANAVMQIQTGLFDIVVVEAHSKISELLTYEHVVELAFDPIYETPLSAERDVHPDYVAGLEMQAYLAETGTTPEQCAAVVVQDKQNALDNPRAPYGTRLEIDDVLRSPCWADPLRKLEVAPRADGCLVFVLAAGEIAERFCGTPVYVEGIGWCSESPWIAARGSEAVYAKRAAEMAYRQAGITNPLRQIDFAEVDDRYAFKLLQHLEALGLAQPGQAGALLLDGMFSRDGELPVNPGGGCLGAGDLIEAGGLARTLEVVLQLRGEAGAGQLPNVRTGVALSWRGIPHGTGAVAVFSRRDS